MNEASDEPAERRSGTRRGGDPITAPRVPAGARPRRSRPGGLRSTRPPAASTRRRRGLGLHDDGGLGEAVDLHEPRGDGFETREHHLPDDLQTPGRAPIECVLLGVVCEVRRLLAAEVRVHDRNRPAHAAIDEGAVTGHRRVELQRRGKDVDVPELSRRPPDRVAVGPVREAIARDAKIGVGDAVHQEEQPDRGELLPRFQDGGRRHAAEEPASPHPPRRPAPAAPRRRGSRGEPCTAADSRRGRARARAEAPRRTHRR